LILISTEQKQYFCPYKIICIGTKTIIHQKLQQSPTLRNSYPNESTQSWRRKKSMLKRVWMHYALNVLHSQKIN